MADGNPFAPMINPNMRQTSLWDLRMMSAANRMETPFERGARGLYHRQGVSGDPMIAGLAGMANEPDYSQFTYDPAMREQAIAAGVQPLEASQVRQNMIFPNTGFFGAHPRLSAALEGGIFGALASHGGETAGESIQGALEGMVGGKRIREGLYRQQFARPFEAAGALEGLRDMQQRRELQGAQIKHYKDESDIQQERVELERQKNQLGLDKLIATRPVPVEGGAYLFGEGQRGPINVAAPWETPPAKPGWQFVPGPGRSGGVTKDMDVATREQLRIAGINPLEATPDQIAAANDAVLKQKEKIAGAGAGARAEATLPYKNLQTATAEHEAKIKGLQAKLLKSDDPQHRKAAEQQYYNNWMAQSAEIAAQNERKHFWEPSIPAPPFNQPTDKDIKTIIDQQNAEIQSQIDAEKQSFAQQYPQTTQVPEARRAAGGNVNIPQPVAPPNTDTRAPGPPVGMVQDGWRFKGGNPADPNAWEKAK